MVTKQAGGKIGELYVFNELLKRGVVSYIPLVDEAVDAVVRTPADRLIQLQIKAAGSAGGKDLRWFQASEKELSNNRFIIGVEVEEGRPEAVWVFPSSIFDKYATRAKGGLRDLNLDTRSRTYGMTLRRDLLCGFRNRWELITEYEKYEALMEFPEDLEDILTMKEAMEAPEEEAVSLEEYERRRSAAVLSSSPLVGED